MAGSSQPTQFGRALQQLASPISLLTLPRPRVALNVSGAPFKIVFPVNCVSLVLADLAVANQVLRRFLPAYNRRFARAPREAEKAWRQAPRKLERICCFHHERLVSNDNVVQWDGRVFQIPPQPQRFTFAGAKVQLYESLEGKIAIYYGRTKLLHSAVEREGVTFFIGPLG